MNLIKNSTIYWQDNTPLSQQFDDYYFNSDGGIDESLHVFIKPNKIDRHLLNILDSDNSGKSGAFLTISETGFGTGLNFYCTLSALQTQAEQQQNIPVYFFSSELFPLSLTDFKKSVANFPQFSHISEQIIQQYPPAIKGFHRLILEGGKIYLTLMFDDSIKAFQQCQHKTDIWYLDGFSPSKNPDMWQDPLFDQVARLSKLNTTTLSSFTSAGFVRRALSQRGFSISKHSGFGKKREMISALYTDDCKLVATEKKKPWFEHQRATQSIKKVAVIGAGLAGCTTAEALARRGVQVTLFDSAEDICQQASGNLQGALYAKLPSKPTTAGELHLTGLEYSLRLLNIYQCFDNITAEQCGLLQLATTDKEYRQQQELLLENCYSTEVVRWVSAEEASAIAGTDTPFPGLFFPRAGWVAPALLCKKLIEHPSIELRLNTSISALITDKAQCLQLALQSNGSSTEPTSSPQLLTFDAVVVASANQAKDFKQLADLSSKAIRGQVTHAPRNRKTQLNTVVCGAGYISPATNSTFCFGASFNLHQQDLELKAQEQQSNIDNLHKVLPSLADNLSFSEGLTGKVAHRCTTPDYLPMAGPAPVYDEYITKYGRLRKDKNWRFDDSLAPCHPGLFVNTGHGAKGLITCPLIAEHLACLITNQPSPLPKNLSDAVHPARFIIKQLIRRAI